MELEHRSPKSRYLRTNRKYFEKQLGSIERRQARIRRIRQKMANSTRSSLTHEKGPESSACAYHIGKTQNHSLDLGAFARDNYRDPAVQVFWSLFDSSELNFDHLYITSEFRRELEDPSPSQNSKEALFISCKVWLQHISCITDDAQHCFDKGQ